MSRGDEVTHTTPQDCGYGPLMAGKSGAFNMGKPVPPPCTCATCWTPGDKPTYEQLVYACRSFHWMLAAVADSKKLAQDPRYQTAKATLDKAEACKDEKV